MSSTGPGGGSERGDGKPGEQAALAAISHRERDR
jgi:hypothetical protein